MTLPSFIESPAFPVDRGWQITAEDDFDVIITKRASGAERRYLQNPLRTTTFTVAIPPDLNTDARIARLWHSNLYGRAVGFRLQRADDYLSCQQKDWLIDLQVPQLPSAQNVPTALDQPLVLLTGTLGTTGSTYQLTKNYSAGLTGLSAYQHPIRKPISGTILVANNSGTPISASGNWSLDTTTGILTQLSGFTGTPTTWGGNFHYPVRFDSKLSLEVFLNRADCLHFALVELPLP